LSNLDIIDKNKSRKTIDHSNHTGIVSGIENPAKYITEELFRIGQNAPRFPANVSGF